MRRHLPKLILCFLSVLSALSTAQQRSPDVEKILALEK